MKYIIMCGGKYDMWKTPRQLQVINGEVLVARTIRLLKENGITDIAITSNDPRFDNFGVPRIDHKNTYEYKDGESYGYWLDAYYQLPDNEKVCYMYGDVYYTDKAIKTIINYESNDNILFGTSAAKNKYHENWGEPFSYKVNNNKAFKEGIEAVKKLQDEGKTNRVPITWELYRYLNNLDINIQQVLDKTYVCIDDDTMDIDYPEELDKMKKEVE